MIGMALLALVLVCAACSIDLAWILAGFMARREEHRNKKRFFKMLQASKQRQGLR